eukprot:CAMPEP_0118920668 /NCGR_PEP_ID=MMETSP1169-20130426/109_1 /TAXON_ID=36882 /ORGANISM="Pyramimonas obovata, Strain CCMP722" /LENGTH=95 /DNA_ID=CAMNT_0006861235 /DNA_START=199 /DNA_END=486 /DNA_ORIENTATION=-
MPLNLDYSHGPVASKRPVKGSKKTEEIPKAAIGATVHKVSEEIEWRKHEVHEAVLHPPRTSVDEEAVPWAMEEEVNTNFWRNLEQVDAGKIEQVL